MNEPASLFGRKNDFILFLLPALLLPFLLTELFYFQNLSLEHKAWMIITTEVILASSGHNGLSWALLFILPEGRLWLRSQDARRFLFRFYAILAILACFGLLFTLIKTTSYWLPLLLWIDIVFLIHHSLSQTKGISFLYMHKEIEQKNVSPKVSHNKLNKTFALLIGTSSASGFFHFFEVKPHLTLVPHVLSSASLFLTIYILDISYKINKKQFLFNLRLLYVPLIFYSFTAAIIFRILHSLEYLFVFDRIIRKSKAQLVYGNHRFYVFCSFFFFLAIGLWCFSPKDNPLYFSLIQNYTHTPLFFQLLATLSIVRLYSHYYLDRKIFGFKDPHSQKYFLKMLR